MVDHNFKVGDVVTWNDVGQGYKQCHKCPDVFTIDKFYDGVLQSDTPSNCVLWKINKGGHCPGANPKWLVLYTGPW